MNFEQQAETENTVQNDEAVAPDKSLTLAAKKLAGSACCLNCGTELKGPFCYYCGQPDRNFMRFFPALLRDMMEDAGFCQCEYHNMTGGIVALHRGLKP